MVSLTVTLAAAAAVTGTAVTALKLVSPDGGSGTQQQGTRSADSGRKGSHPPAVGTSASSFPKPSGPSTGLRVAQPTNLLTPAGVRAAIKALRKVMGGTKVTEFTVYKEYATAEAPTRANPKLYDRFEYRDGKATRSGPGGTLSTDDATVNLNAADWDALPALLKKADKELGVDKPTIRYIIVGPDLFTNKPSLRVYVADEYGGGYLSADFNGAVQRRYPRS